MKVVSSNPPQINIFFTVNLMIYIWCHSIFISYMLFLPLLSPPISSTSSSHPSTHDPLQKCKYFQNNLYDEVCNLSYKETNCLSWCYISDCVRILRVQWSPVPPYCLYGPVGSRQDPPLNNYCRVTRPIYMETIWKYYTKVTTNNLWDAIQS